MTARTLIGRVVAPGSVGTRHAVHVLERNLLVTRSHWQIIVSGFFEPLFYLFAIGIGIGRLAGEVVGPDGLAVAYAAFVAPAMLASSAMNGAVYESTINIFFKMRYGKIYDVMLATPMRPGDVAAGEIGWSLLRGAVYATAFLLVMAGMGLTRSWWAVAALPAAILIGFAFASVGMAASSFMRTPQDLDLVNLVTLPLFLFSATFYPLDVYPPLVQTLTQLSPLYHGVELIRGLTLGVVRPVLLVHVGFLAAMGAIGLVWASRRVEALLLR